MDDREVDKLLEQAFSDGTASSELGQRVLRDSAAALTQGQPRHRPWRTAALAAAAVFIAAVAFLSGRASVADRQPTEVAATAPDAETVSVPTEMIAWMEAARFFKQLGMDERVALAYERAGRLIPEDVPMTAGAPTTLYAEQALPHPAPDDNTEQPVNKPTVILAHSFGG